MTMTEPTIRDQAYQCFQQEALDLLQTLEEGLLNIQTQHDVPHIHQLMRAAHSIKGGAASVELPGIQKIAHRLEDIFRALYRREDPLDDDLEEALLQAYDCLRLPLLEQLQTNQYDEAEAWAKAEPIFALLEAVLQNEMNAASFELPSAAELGVDLVYEVFSGDVRQGIERLAHLVQNPAGQMIVGEVRATAEVFVGLGELLGLSGFSAIAQSTLQALDAQPDQALAIAQATIECLESAIGAVIAGDRTEGGCPSPALLAFTRAQSSAQPPEVDRFEAPFHPHQSLDLRTDYVALEDMFGQGIPDSTAIANLSTGFENLENIFGQVVLDPDAGASLASVPTLEDIFDPSALTLDSASSVDFSLFPEDLAQASLLQPDVWEIEQVAAPNPSALPSELLPSSGQPPDLTSSKPVEVRQSINQAKDAPYRGESVRVDFLRLERLNNLVGELVTQENGVLLQSQQLQDRLKRLQQRFHNFEQVSKTLQDWMDQSLQSGVKPQNSGVTAQPETSASDLSDLTDFDPLQMDSYSKLYTMLQESLEEISQMGENIRDMNLISQQAQQIQRQKQQTLKQVRNDLLWARMMPIGDVLNRFPRMIRDLATQYGKRVRFKQSGSSTLVDKAILERLYDPLVHLVRNAFDHGADLPEARVALGKAAEATIEIRAYHRGNQTFIEVRDDGKGINLDRVRAAAIEQGLLTAETAEAIAPAQLYPYLFEPSFSTQPVASEISGRGMGLATVQSQVQTLKGSIQISSEVGQGTTFTLCLPLTLTIAKLLVFTVDSYSMAIPIDTLLAIVAADDSEIRTIQGQSFYRYQDQLIALYPPSSFTHAYPLPKGFTKQRRTMSLPQQGKVPLLLISNGSEVIALEVDQILDEQELVIKPFGRVATPPSYLYGCAILGDGALVPVVDGSIILAKWKASGTEPQQHRVTSQPKPFAQMSDYAQTILVVDDSLTTRQNVTLTLQKFGYRVIQAGDGKEALEQLRREPQIKAVVSDVEMPNMNGFEFLSSCRKTWSADTLPIMMLTSRSSEKHRGIAKLLGANHYLTKPYLEQDLLTSLQTCLEKVRC